MKGNIIEGILICFAIILIDMESRELYGQKNYT